MQTAHTKPETLAGYLEAMSRATLTAGISWRVVHSKWDGIKEAFADFDPEKVAAMTPDDVDRLMQDPRVIRNRKKTEAIVDDAATMLEIDRGNGGFVQYLASRGSFEQRLDAIRHTFAFMGPSTAYIFLALVGDSDADWGFMHERGQTRAGSGDAAGRGRRQSQGLDVPSAPSRRLLARLDLVDQERPIANAKWVLPPRRTS